MAASSGKPWYRRWSVWVVAAVLVGWFASSGAEDSTEEAADVSRPAPVAQTPVAGSSVAADETATSNEGALLFVTDLKDGDSWDASDGNEYRVGLVDTPERGEPCSVEATRFTRKFLADGFTVDAYSSDTHDRVVAEVFNADGDSLNIALVESGLAGDRYLETFRHENRELADRIDAALASAASPSCRSATPRGFVESGPKTTEPSPKVDAPAKSCAQGYSPCLPVVADLNCPDIGHTVKVTGVDQYQLDRDRDGIGCD
jgi:hypothetical protein